MNRTIRISGAGIAGLTAAINLAKNDFDVVIYEKWKDVGTRFNNDFQGLENWSTKEDILDILNDINIKTDFWYRAFNEADLIDDSTRKYKITSRRIGVYMVQRGNENMCLDQYLKNQALDFGVDIQFNKRVDEKDIDIIATGPRFASAMAYGIKGDVHDDDKVMFMLDDNLAPKGYIYMAIIDGKITLASVMFKNFGKARSYFEHALKKIGMIYNIEIKNGKHFSGRGNFVLLNSYKNKKGDRLLVGERAGFQDYLFGFGMRYAFLSGYFAAQSIMRELDYDFLIKENLINKMKSSLINRYFYEKLGNNGYRKLIKKWISSSDPLDFLNEWYNYNWYKHLIYPISLRWYKKR